jgi:hypothetical protein
MYIRQLSGVGEVAVMQAVLAMDYTVSQSKAHKIRLHRPWGHEHIPGQAQVASVRDQGVVDSAASVACAVCKLQ